MTTTITAVTLEADQLEVRASALVSYYTYMSMETARIIVDAYSGSSSDPLEIIKDVLGEDTNLSEFSAEDAAKFIDGALMQSKLITNLDLIVGAVSADISSDTMRKLTKEQIQTLGYSDLREIRSPAARPVPDEKSFIIQMVDSSFKPYGIYVAEQAVVTALKLLPNPNTLSLNSAKIVNRYQTMTRWVEEYWGDQIDTVTFSGSTYSFFAYEKGGNETTNVGLTVEQRNKTKSYEMLRELATFFTYNGCLYQDSMGYDYSSPMTKSFLDDPKNSYFTVRHPRTGMIKERLYVNLYYDYFSLLGYFDSFDVIEESGTPYRITYNANFKAERTKWHQGNLARLWPSIVGANQQSDPEISTPLPQNAG